MRDAPVDAEVLLPPVLTPLAIKGLRWIAEHEPVAWFDGSAPTLAMRKKLKASGLIEQVPDDRPIHFVQVRLTETGRAALRAAGASDA